MGWPPNDLDMVAFFPCLVKREVLKISSTVPAWVYVVMLSPIVVVCLFAITSIGSKASNVFSKAENLIHGSDLRQLSN